MNKSNILIYARLSGIDEKFAKENKEALLRFANKIICSNYGQDNEPIGWISNTALYGLTKTKDKKFFNIYHSKDGNSKIPVYCANEITE